MPAGGFGFPARRLFEYKNGPEQLAGDWIKLRCDLWDDPRVVSIKRSMKIPHAAVVGGLFRLWVLADQHSEDGELFGYTAADLDALCGKKGWADALAAVGWLEVYPDKIVVPRFEEHNGKSGKKRAQDYKDQQKHRGKGSVRNPSGLAPDKTLTREEKSKRRVREEDVDADDDLISCFEEERPEFDRLYRILTTAARPDDDRARQWMGKAVVLVIRDRLSVDVFEQVVESYVAKEGSDKGIRSKPGWAWDRFEEWCKSKKINWGQLLVKTVVISDWMVMS